MKVNVFNNKKSLNRTAILFTLLLTFTVAIEYLKAAPVYPVRVTNIRFLNGIGRGPTSSGGDFIAAYYRGYGLPGTLIEITADMNNGSWGAPMYGDVMFTISYTDGTNTGTFTANIQSGSFTATTEIPYNFSTAWLASGTTAAWTYRATSATGDYVANSGLPASIVSSASQVINWDRNDPPYAPGTPAITVNQLVITATSFTIYWTPYSTVPTGMDQDFYEYRIYYREEDTSTFKQWNSSNDSTLGGLGNNPSTTPVSDPARHFNGNGWKYTTIPNLKLFTGYEYYITAVDVFGNEISVTDAGPAAGSRLVRTSPLQIEAEISDGITKYTDFSNLSDPSLRTLREANTRVDIYTVSAVTQPDECYIWFTTTNAPSADIDDIITPLLKPNVEPYTPGTTAFSNGANLSSVKANRTGPNVWTAYIPTLPSNGKNKIVANGNSVRFIVELKNRGISTFVDKDSGTSANDAEWTYAIGTPVKVTPWPVRILNNVITDSNPRAYPSYYLSEDGYVTIRVYDVKGRPVAVLLESALRRGGQNIKEEGWTGSNKSGQKLGIGLYYIHVSAKSVSSGKIILDTYKKVVMRH